MNRVASQALSLTDVTVGYGGVKAVIDASLTMERGAVVGVMGPNGAGKSSLLNCIAGLVRPVSGRISLAGEDITQMRAYKRARRGIAVASQRPRPIEEMTVLDHVLLGRRLRPADSEMWEPGELLGRCGLGSVSDCYPAELSPAELRRLELAKALAPEPSLLLLDEVGAGLPPAELELVASTVRDAAKAGTAVLVVDHVMDLLLGVSERLIGLDLGRIIADGKPEEVIHRDEIVSAYFGKEVTDAAES